MIAERVGDVLGSQVGIADFRAQFPRRFDELCEYSNLPIVDRRSTRGFRYLIDCVDARLGIVDIQRPSSKPFTVDHDATPRRLAGGDMLRRALGRTSRKVVDATAGFGYDAVHFARLGFDVIAVERCEPIAMMLRDALGRIADPVLRDRISVIPGDSVHLLPALGADVVYLDPMFASVGRQRSLPRRRMVLARELAGEDWDSRELLQVARGCSHRVVVKRPDKSAPLSGGVHHSHAGKTVRYDVYLDAPA